MALLPVADALQRIFDFAVASRIRRRRSSPCLWPHACGVPSPPGSTTRLSMRPQWTAMRSAQWVLRRRRRRLSSSENPAPAGPSKAGSARVRPVRIFTGGSVPDGADTVVIQENVLASGTTVTIREVVARGANVRARGQDFTKGEILLERGRRLTARDVLLAAAARATQRFWSSASPSSRSYRPETNSSNPGRLCSTVRSGPPIRLALPP